MKEIINFGQTNMDKYERKFLKIHGRKPISDLDRKEIEFMTEKEKIDEKINKLVPDIRENKILLKRGEK